MNYYWFNNRQEILLKTKEKYSRVKAAEFYAQNKEAMKEKSRVNVSNVDKTVVSDKIKHNNKGFKHFIGYQEGGIVKPLRIILPQMSGYITNVENGGKNMSFLIKDDEVWEKYDKI